MYYRDITVSGNYITIGRMGDNLATRVILDVSDITEQYGSEGEFTLLVKSKVKNYVYPVVIEVDMESNEVVWIPTAEDTSNGKAIGLELVYTVEDQVVYNKIYSVVFGESFADKEVGNAPEAAWMSQTLREARNAVNAAQNASASASEAESANREAQRTIETVRGYASDAKASEESAKASAEEAEGYTHLIGQATMNAGYMYFYIDDHGDLIYQRTSNTEVDFYLSDGDLYVKAVS